MNVSNITDTALDGNNSYDNIQITLLVVFSSIVILIFMCLIFYGILHIFEKCYDNNDGDPSEYPPIIVSNTVCGPNSKGQNMIVDRIKIHMDKCYHKSSHIIENIE